MNPRLARYLPSPLVEFIRGCRYRGTAEHFRFLWSSKRNQDRFHTLNAGLPPGRIALAPGVAFEVLPEVRATFEEFTHRNAEMVDEMTAFLRLATGCRSLLDIGSLYGAFSLAFCAATGGRAAAFEPNRVSRQVLDRHVALNPGCAIEVLPFGVGESSRTVSVEAGFHFTALGEGHPTPLGVAVAEMEVVALDEFCSGRGLWPDLLKIDVEGFEHFVLLGARELLRRRQPRLLIEFHPDLMALHGHTPAATLDLLEEAGYAGYTPRFSALEPTWMKRSGNMRAVFTPRGQALPAGRA